MAVSVDAWPARRVAVSGSREGHPRVTEWMHRWWAKRGPCVWILGGARGVDTQARVFCDRMGWPYLELPALWSQHGRAAGARRNREMFEWSAPDGPLLAFPRSGPGTRQCMELFDRHGRLMYVAKPP